MHYKIITTQNNIKANKLCHMQIYTNLTMA
jgi:hypothetical protein